MTHDVFNAQVHVFRFYADGTESGSSPYGGAAENANVNVDVSSGDVQIHLRVGIQENGAGSASGAATDDWGVQCTSSVSGAFTVTGSSTRVKADTGSSLTDGSATTNRATNGISDGGGTFVAGEQEETNGVIEDHQLTADNFTEHVYAFLVVAADVANAETLDFAITLNGSTTASITNSVTPRITITKTADTSDVESIAANTHLGQFWMPKALSTMIPSGMRFMPDAAEASAAPEFAYLQSTSANVGGNSSYTYTSENVGNSADGRVIYFMLTWQRSAAGTPNLSSITLNGDSCTSIVNYANGASGQRMGTAIFTIAQSAMSSPSITSADVVATWDAIVNAAALHTYRGVGYSASATATGTDLTTDPLSATITFPSGGIVLGCAFNWNNNGAATWNLDTEDYDVYIQIGNWSRNTAAHSTDVTGGSAAVECDFATVGTQYQMACASFAVA